MSDRPNELESNNELLDADELLQRAWERLQEITNMSESELLNMNDDDLYTIFSESIGAQIAEESDESILIDSWYADGYNSDWITLKLALMAKDENGQLTDPLQQRMYNNLLAHAFPRMGWEGDENYNYIAGPPGGYDANGWSRNQNGDFISPQGKTAYDLVLEWYETHQYSTTELWYREEHKHTPHYNSSNSGNEELKY